MWFKLAQWVLSFVSGPLLGKALDAWKAKLASDTDQTKIAADLATRELAVQQREIEVQNQLKIAEVGHPWEPEKLGFYITIAFYAKCLIYDKMMGLGSTDPLGGDVQTWAMMIMAFYYGKRTIENVTTIFKRK